MNGQQRFDRNARTWLESGPTEAPERAVRAALIRIDTTPQERDFRVPWRIPTVSRFSVLGAAAVLAVALGLGGMLVLGRPSTTEPGGAPTTAPTTPSGTPAASPTPRPTPSPTPVALTGTYTSPTYGYSIAVGPDWVNVPASKAWSGVDNNDTNMDHLTITGTDTSIGIASQPLPRDTTFDEWLVPFWQAGVDAVPLGCDGGNPSAWPTVPVGDVEGRWQQLCNATQVLALANGRVYVFVWGNDTFTAGQHFQPSSFKALLETVQFTAIP